MNWKFYLYAKNLRHKLFDAVRNIESNVCAKLEIIVLQFPHTRFCQKFIIAYKIVSTKVFKGPKVSLKHELTVFGYVLYAVVCIFGK